MTYIRLAQPTTCERCGRDLPRRAEAWRGDDGVSATCLHCLSVPPTRPQTDAPPPPAGEVLDLTTPRPDADADPVADAGPAPADDDGLVLPDPGGRAAPVGDRRQRALTEADLAPAADGVRPISAAARPRPRRHRST